jgi:imidazolonepropionase
VIEVWADEISTPLIKGGLLRLRPGRLLIGPNGIIQKIEKISTAKLRTHSRKIIREKVIIPGLIDSHTHLVFAGNRADEWGARLKGVSYQQIAKKGGGILKTLQATRAATTEELKTSAEKRLRECIRNGITTIEIKSGYGLDLKSELKILRVIQSLKKTKSLPRLMSTFMGAHAVPKDFSSSSKFIDYLIETVLPQVEGLADFQDVFCEKGYFSEKDSIRILLAGKKRGLKPKVHAHEFGRTGGVKVASLVKAISADHLMVLNEKDIRLLKTSKVIPILLPGTSFFLGAKKFAPARKLWDAGLKVAIASDFNPGTNPTMNLPLCGTLAAIHQGLSLEEILIAQTLHAAWALDLRDRGSLEKGMRADFIGLDAECFEEIYYSYGNSKVVSAYLDGKKIH